ncbi:Rpn family recombination-promoting nuclease/putative transposase [Olivibacter sp. XZL3]|uniref:Rpn family recombination-promoting nuclease/putative transposase n=1 Tax=Olivibacter sp. XZL3 TaxID=1735116 RepID=UPI001065C74F|nr:Rpn family recombination-promoting nuclease/putative transposase [Olivibacter sp. XZL3]
MNTEESYIKPGKFVDPLSDFGFRHYFGSEPNKEILIEFLNDLFEGVEYGPNEHDGDDKEDKRVVFDLHCRGSNGEYFIIEMQRIRQEYFRDRALYYSSRLIQRQLPKGKAFNSYQLPEVFLIALLEFRMEEKQRSHYFHDIALCNKSTGEIFYKKLGFKFIELPNFVKTEGELDNERDKWFYLLKHMSNMDQVPKFLDKRVFKLIFKIGTVSKLSKEERMAYEASLKAKWDTQNAFDHAIKEAAKKAAKEAAEEATKKAREEERARAEKEKHKVLVDSAKSLKETGLLSNEQIAKSLKLPLDVVENL